MAPVGLVTSRDHALPTDHTLKLFHILPDTPVSITFPDSFCKHGMTIDPKTTRSTSRGVYIACSRLDRPGCYVRDYRNRHHGLVFRIELPIIRIHM